jgi:UPF0755 protein
MKKLIAAFIAALLAGTSLAWFVNSPPPQMRERTFTVQYGESTRAIARKLREGDLIRSRMFFIAASYLLGKRYIRTGRYRIFSGTGTFGILTKLTRGDIISRKVTVPEGFNLFQIAARLEAASVCGADAFTGYATDRAFLGQLGIESQSAEGYLFPDTYVFPEGSDARDVIAAMHKRMKSVVGERPAYGPGMSLHEMLTMASLVEKEARVYAEREFISSVFHNRLRRGMKLDCDPTVRYAVKKFTGPITVSDLKNDSPYNTYLRRGLPPTPICAPGRDSILAAMYPKKTDLLYFVARNDGSHQFSKTLREHNEAVQKYQR